MLLAAAALAAGAGASPVPLIIDTDAGFDVDDVGAVCIVRPTPTPPLSPRPGGHAGPVPRFRRPADESAVQGNALEDLGEANIIAVGHTNGFVKGIGGVSTLMHHCTEPPCPRAFCTAC